MFFLFDFILIGQLVDRKLSGREKGAGSGKVNELGLKLGTTKAQRRCVSAAP